MLLNVDRGKIRFDYYPVPEEETGHTLVLPSMTDESADLWIEGTRQVQSGEWNQEFN